MLHASTRWSREWFDAPPSDVTDALLTEFGRLFDLPTPNPSVTSIRRWSFARASSPLDRGAVFDETTRIGLGGDWLCEGRIEGAFLSGVALATRVLDE